MSTRRSTPKPPVPIDSDAVLCERRRIPLFGIALAAIGVIDLAITFVVLMAR
jgi:hypothetical protein